MAESEEDLKAARETEADVIAARYWLGMQYPTVDLDQYEWTRDGGLIQRLARFRAQGREAAEKGRDEALHRQSNPSFNPSFYYVKGEHRAEAAEARLREVEQERDKLRETNTDLNRRASRAEAGLLALPGATRRTGSKVLNGMFSAMKAEVHELRAALAEYRLRCNGWTIHSAETSSFPGIERAPDDSWEVQNQRVDALLARTEPKDGA